MYIVSVSFITTIKPQEAQIIMQGTLQCFKEHTKHIFVFHKAEKGSTQGADTIKHSKSIIKAS